MIANVVARAGELTVGRRVFWFKALGILLGLIVAWSIFFDRYRFGHDDQISKCLPGWNFMIIDKHDHDYEIGKVVAFEAKGLEPLFADGSTIVKVIRGMPGNTVSVFTDRVEVDGVVVGEGLLHAETMKIDPERFVRTFELGEDEFLVMGESADSFDGRYWGPLSRSLIEGAAHRVY